MKRRRRWWAACAAALAATVSCARPYPPTGGDPDQEAPWVVATEPEAMAVVPGWDEPVVFRFNERISENGIEQSVMVSPETGEVRIDKGRSELRVSLEGGWQPGQIYRVVVLPVVRDLFGNVRGEPIDLVFSTGPEIPGTALAGRVSDRLTGRPVPDARVEAVRRADSTVYVARTDTAGIYAMRHIPAGEYDLNAFVDQVMNRRPDFTEPYDSGATVLAATDTTLISFSLLRGDTTAAHVTGATAPDSGHIQVRLDDYLDPEVPLDGVTVELLRLPDSTAVEIADVMHEHAWEALEARRRAVADSLAAASDSAAAEKGAVTPGAEPARPDSAAASGAGGAGAAAPAESTGRGAGRPADPAAIEAADSAGAGGVRGGAPDAAAADSVALPSRTFVVVPAAPLPPETDFVIRVTGIRNIHGLTDGGGTAELRTPKRPAPPADTAAADTVPALAPDTVPPAAPDTLRPGPVEPAAPPAAVPSSAVSRPRPMPTPSARSDASPEP
ncbi:MAG TPA: carboxypeptidase-like regulatory domain-containing protein [Longimicrobiales bacterium]